MEHLSKYLKRFQKIVVSAKGTEESFRRATELVLGDDIGFFSLSQKGNTLFVRATPTAKNAILLNQQKILSEFKTRSGLSFTSIK
ncbi:MAG TPA: hypothetical protein VJJ27_01620 [Candidatus Paceibacterota bacterium]